MFNAAQYTCPFQWVGQGEEGRGRDGMGQEVRRELTDENEAGDKF